MFYDDPNTHLIWRDYCSELKRSISHLADTMEDANKKFMRQHEEDMRSLRQLRKAIRGMFKPRKEEEEDNEQTGEIV